MPSTVIASRHGLSLFVLPLTGKPVDEARLAQILDGYGLRLVPGVAHHSEFVAAEDLDGDEASALAADLEAMGLTVRVVDRTEIHRSARIGNALSANVIAAAGLAITALAALAGDVSGALLAPAVVGSLWATGNLLTLVGRGGLALRRATVEGTSSDGDVIAAIAAMRGQLPDAILDPLEARARSLQRRARSNPDGAAARALAELAGELRDLDEAEQISEVRDLKEALTRARRAMLETQGPR